jgi:hypothetical protein
MMILPSGRRVARRDTWPVAGPSFSVLTPRCAAQAELAVIEALVALGLTSRADSPDWYSPTDLPYGYNLQTPDQETEPDELDAIEAFAGRRMTCDICLHLFVSDRAGRPLLARIAAGVARRVDGWIFVDLSGPATERLAGHLATAGRCLPLFNRSALYLDAAAMDAWIQHPEFHVVK